MAEGGRQNRSSRKVQGFNVAAWDTAKDPVATTPQCILHHHSHKEMARSAKEPEQHQPLWQNLQTIAPL